MSLPLFTDVIISPIIVILVIIWLICYHRRDKSKVSKTTIQFVKFMRFLRCKCSAKKHKTDDDRNMKLASNTVMAYPTLFPLCAGSKNTKTFRMDIKQVGRIRLSTKNMGCFKISIRYT
jgi:hypothetical protein